MIPLNPQLYGRLMKLYRGDVRVANVGVPFDPISLYWGETYHVNCPICQDGKSKRRRLYISHAWGYDRPYLIYCHNEPHCLPGNTEALKFLLDTVYNFQDPTILTSELLWSDLGNDSKPSARSPSAVRMYPLPIDFTLVKDLPESHPAIQYLRNRNFDPVELSECFRVGYAEKTPDNEPRLIAPVWQFGQYVGWQGRSLTNDKKAKYYSQLSVASNLYNLDACLQGDTIVVFEGITDVWRWGPVGAVASFGCRLSEIQKMKLRSIRRVIVAYDSDAFVKALGLTKDLRRYGISEAIAVRFPDSVDPADMTRDDLHLFIEKTLADHERERRQVPFIWSPQTKYIFAPKSDTILYGSKQGIVS